MCKKAKATKDAYNRLLQPLPVPKKPWIDMMIDFMTGLPKCHAYSQIYNVILIVIDCLSKKHYYISCLKDNEGTSAKVTAELFIQYVWSRQRLPISLTSNRELQFAAKM